MTKPLPLTRWVFLLTGIHALVCVPAIILAERLGWSPRTFRSLFRLYSVPMKNLSSVLFVASLLALASCADVTSKQVIGDTPAKLDPKKWNGAWAVADGESIHVRVKSADLGLLEVAWLEVEEEAIKLTRLDVRITEAGGWLWASYKEEEDKAFAIARISEPDENLLAWTMESGPFIKRVKSGELKGEVLKDDKGKETKDVLLDGLHDADLKDIKDGKWGEVFDWGKPALIFRRLRD